VVKKKRSNISIMFALVVIAAIVGVCVYAVLQNSFAPPATREDKSVFTPKDNVVIQAATFSGNIKVQPTTGSQIEVIYQVSAPNGYLNDVTTLAKETASGNSTTINANAALQVNNGVAYTANLIINVPSSSTYNLTLTTHNGNVAVQVDKSIEIGAITDNGDINVNLPQNTQFQVTASVANGKISHEGIALDANPDSATRLLGNTVGGAGSLVMTFMSGNGDITLGYFTP
jgi:DUF4097 and DUF4098 domain-containing protein YvlB